MPLYREIQGLCFYVWFVGQIMDSNKCSFALFVYNVISVGQETMAVQKNLN